MSALIDEYRRIAVAYGFATSEGDTEGIDNANERLQEAFKTLVAEQQADELFHFYDDVDPWVQLAAATHTLELDESRAMAKLLGLERAKIPHVSTEAKYTIEGWKNGDLRFLPS